MTDADNDVRELVETTAAAVRTARRRTALPPRLPRLLGAGRKTLLVLGGGVGGALGRESDEADL